MATDPTDPAADRVEEALSAEGLVEALTNAAVPIECRPEDARYLSLTAVLNILDAVRSTAPATGPGLDITEHVEHPGNHDGYACGFSAAHCWGCGEPWPCRVRQTADKCHAGCFSGGCESCWITGCDHHEPMPALRAATEAPETEVGVCPECGARGLVPVGTKVEHRAATDARSGVDEVGEGLTRTAALATTQPERRDG